VRLGLSAKGTADLFQDVLALDYGHCRLSVGVPRAFAYSGPVSLQGKRIATTYPRIVEDWLRSQGIEASVVEFSGAVEIAPSLGRADVVCDLVSSGATMKAHDLVESEVLLQSSAALIQTPIPLETGKQAWIERLLKRIQGVQQVKESKYIMLHAPRSALSAITALLPGAEAPTIIPLEGRDDKVAVHAVCRENVFWETLENLKKAGASSLLVLPVEKMLA
jgi:ATP phosphoribosyltransferase